MTFLWEADKIDEEKLSAVSKRALADLRTRGFHRVDAGYDVSLCLDRVRIWLSDDYFIDGFLNDLEREQYDEYLAKVLAIKVEFEAQRA